LVEHLVQQNRDNLEVVPNCVVSLYAIDAANTSAVMRLPSVALLALSLRSISSSYAFTTHIRHQTLPTPRTPSSSSLASSTTADEPPKTAAAAATPPTSVAVEFPPPLTKAQRLQRAAKFWSSALPIVLSYYSKSAELQLTTTLTGRPLTQEEEEIIWNAQHESGARKLADTISSLKGFYVKTAQIISSRKDLFPKEYTEALSMFTDNVDPLPVELIRAVVEKELLVRGETFEDIFAEFDEVPLGA
jgi:hypothetical protein